MYRKTCSLNRPQIHFSFTQVTKSQTCVVHCYDVKIRPSINAQYVLVCILIFRRQWKPVKIVCDYEQGGLFYSAGQHMKLGRGF